MTRYFSFDNVCDAMHTAIVSNNYQGLDEIIGSDLNALVQLRRSKTPIFSIIEDMLGENGHLTDGQRQHLIDSIADTLRHIFTSVNSRLAYDQSLLNKFIHSSCNHISHTQLLPTGATVRDIIEEYAGINTETNMDRKYTDFCNLVSEFGLLHKSGVIFQRFDYNPSEHLRGNSL